MEGSYNRVYKARDRVPREEFRFLLERLMGQVRYAKSGHGRDIVKLTIYQVTNRCYNRKLLYLVTPQERRHTPILPIGRDIPAKPIWRGGE
jgi:hypothetical protein